MANGIELHFGFTHDQFNLAEEMLGITIDLNEQEISSNDQLVNVNSQLEIAYLNALEKAEFSLIKKEDDYFNVRTPAGLRSMMSFRLSIEYDPSELCDKPKDAILSVALSGRYKPIFIDYESPNGALGKIETDSPLVRIAKESIVDKVPVFAEAKSIAIYKHY